MEIKLCILLFRKIKILINVIKIGILSLQKNVNLLLDMMDTFNIN